MTTTTSLHPIAACSAEANQPLVAVCALAVRTDAAKLRLIPAGTFDAQRGSMEDEGPWHLDATSAQLFSPGLRVLMTGPGVSTISGLGEASRKIGASRLAAMDCSFPLPSHRPISLRFVKSN